VLAADMGSRLGQPIVVENRAGATGSIGQDYVSRAAPDGYTVVMITSTSSNNYHLMRRSIDFVKDFAMIGEIYRPTPCSPSSGGARHGGHQQPAAAHRLCARASQRAELHSSGTGSLGHLVAARMMLANNLKMEHINYKGQSRPPPTCWRAACPYSRPRSPSCR